MVRVWLATVLVLGLTSGALASPWPTPAAGQSASGDPEILFTFDDGPNPTTTPKVLDILAEHRIRAVFFMVGAMVDSPNKKVAAIVARVLREGHVIANHTMTHADLCRVPLAKAISEIDDGKAAIEKVAQVPLVWFRAPFGARCDRLDGQLAERGTIHMHWDLDPQEWKHGDLTKTVNYVTGSLARSSARNVLLLHDIKPVTVKALPEILGWIAAENVRRTTANRRPIRILQASDVALEQLPVGLAAWSADVVTRLRGLRSDLSSVLPGR